MKKLFGYFFAVLLAIGSTACDPKTPEPENSAPVISGENNQSININVDDGDVYQVVRTVTSMTGVSKVVLKAYTEVINTQTEFTDPKSVSYAFDIDLTELTFDNGIAIAEYTIEATDIDGKMTAQKFTLTVREGSIMMVAFPTTSDLETPFEEYTVKFKVFKGQSALAKIDVAVGAHSQTINMSDSTVKSEYDMAVLVRGLVSGSNTITITVTNDKSETVEATKTIIRKPAKTWENFADLDGYGFSGGIIYNRDLSLVDQGGEALGQHTIKLNNKYRPYNNKADAYKLSDFSKLYRIEMSASVSNKFCTNGYDLYYNDDNMVSKVTRWRGILDYSVWPEVTTVDSTVYTYTYNENNQVIKVAKGDNDAAPSDYLTDFVYNSDEIVSYRISGVVYTPIYTEINGERVRIDHMTGPVSSGKTYTFSKEDVNPTYLSFLPAVVPFAFTGDLLADNETVAFTQLFYNKYLIKTISNGPTFNIKAVENGDNHGKVDVFPTNPQFPELSGKSYSVIETSQNNLFSEGGKEKLIRYSEYSRTWF